MHSLSPFLGNPLSRIALAGIAFLAGMFASHSPACFAESASPLLAPNAQAGNNFPDGQSQYQAFAPDGIPFIVANDSWNVENVGNHRAVVSVPDSTQTAVVVTLPWRRPDARPESKRVIVRNATTDAEIKNVRLLQFSSEKGIIAFQPETGVETYYVYYLPYKFRKGMGDGRYGRAWNDYLLPKPSANPDWEKSVKEKWTTLPVAKVERFESRSQFDFWTPMGLIATHKEIEQIKEKHFDDFILFPEDRAFPIRLKTIPVRWTKKTPTNHFEGFASPNEYYTWQIGLWASKKNLEKVNLQFSNFTHSSGQGVLSAKDITCFNLGGTNWNGKPIHFTVNVPKDNVQALWCGLQIPANVRGGKYTGTVAVSSKNEKPQLVEVVIHIGKDFLADKGDGELWRHARLRWLNSTIGTDDSPVAPYKGMSADGRTITASGKTLVLGANGLPQSIEINGQRVLEQPMEFVVTTESGKVSFVADNVTINKATDGLIRWKVLGVRNGLKFNCDA